MELINSAAVVSSVFIYIHRGSFKSAIQNFDLLFISWTIISIPSRAQDKCTIIKDKLWSLCCMLTCGVGFYLKCVGSAYRPCKHVLREWFDFSGQSGENNGWEIFQAVRPFIHSLFKRLRCFWVPPHNQTYICICCCYKVWLNKIPLLMNFMSDCDLEWCFRVWKSFFSQGYIKKRRFTVFSS